MRGQHPKLTYTLLRHIYKRRMEYNDIKQLVLDAGYEFFEEGNYNLNMIWERTSDKFTNMFTDFLHTLYMIDGTPIKITLPATTKASLYGVGGVTNPVTGGTAIIVPGQYKSAWQFTMGNGTGIAPWGKPYFQQIQGINYYRDDTKDDTIDEINLETNKIYGTNWHVMGEPLSSTRPGSLSWSEGCMGISEQDMISVLLPILTKANAIWGNVYTGTILKTY